MLRAAPAAPPSPPHAHTPPFTRHRSDESLACAAQGRRRIRQSPAHSPSSGLAASGKTSSQCSYRCQVRGQEGEAVREGPSREGAEKTTRRRQGPPPCMAWAGPSQAEDSRTRLPGPQSHWQGQGLPWADTDVLQGFVLRRCLPVWSPVSWGQQGHLCIRGSSGKPHPGGCPCLCPHTALLRVTTTPSAGVPSTWREQLVSQPEATGERG